MMTKSAAFITGATDGIGLHTARKLAASGDFQKLIVLGRDAQKLAKAKLEISRVAPPELTVQTVQADLADLSQVKDMCTELLTERQSTDDRLSLLINNAGVYSPEHVTTLDGFELTYQVNCLAPHIITSMLHPIVDEKIIHVASISASSSVDLDAYRASRNAASRNAASSYSAHLAYSESKLINVLQACAYAERLGNLIVQSLDPGTVNTKMLLAGWGPCGIDVSTADNQFSLATRAGDSGAYFVNDRQARYPSTMCTDRGSLGLLLEVLEEHTGVGL